MTQPGLDPSAAPLVVRTVDIDDPGDLLALLPTEDAVAWLHRGDGIVGWGQAASFECGGPDRFAEASTWWREVTRHAVVRDNVGLPGCGLLALGTFAFADVSAASSLLVVPEVVVGRREGRAWVTVIGHGIGADPDLRPTEPVVAPQPLDLRDGDVGRDEWRDVVRSAVARIQTGDLEKVVLARQVVATPTDGPLDLDVRAPLRRLATDYPGCWTFHLDGFFGASPEMLVRLERGLVTSRVLAGTIRRTGDDARDLPLAASLARSSKDLEEHEFAVRSVADALRPHCTSTNVPEAPYVLHLPNVMHLATDVTGVVSDGASALSLAAALHPSAAVGGTPRAEAVRLIAEIEGLDRGRFAGPVGWIDARGDGEWAIGLRSAQVDDDRIRLFAGCGVVADSVPDDELAESDAKLIPVTDALASGPDQEG